MIVKRKKETRVTTKPGEKKVETIVKEVGHGYKSLMKDSIHGLFDFKQ